MIPNIFDAVGMAGVAVILGVYLALQLEKLSINDWRYSAVNILGAILILISLIHSFNLASFIIEMAWLVISIFGLFRAFKKGRTG